MCISNTPLRKGTRAQVLSGLWELMRTSGVTDVKENEEDKNKLTQFKIERVI